MTPRVRRISKVKRELKEKNMTDHDVLEAMVLFMWDHLFGSDEGDDEGEESSSASSGDEEAEAEVFLLGMPKLGSLVMIRIQDLLERIKI